MNSPIALSQEIIIVRRNSGDGDGGHHGGAWKIAYADFVTAMMAFFLVMWLVNSANEVTKSRVASYFNPIKMTDSSASSRGLKNPTDKKAAKIESDKPEGHGEGSEKAAALDKTMADAEEALLENPFAAMDHIVAQGLPESQAEKFEVDEITARDPFDPKAWKMSGGRQLGDDKLQSKSPVGDKPAGLEVSPQKKTTAGSDVEKQADIETDDGVEHKTIKHEAVSAKDDETLVLEKTLKDLAYKHRSELDISVDVRRTEEGLLIKLGDNSGKGMFPIGSAEPGPGLIDIVGVIGQLLSQQAGDVVVRGHTDGRQYKSGRRDNWQLSTARAHMASYMLMRGGLDERRVSRIEGHGAAAPISTSDPYAAANRRVEFLLRPPGP
jgi:chemotaxis protein MotB